MDKFGLIGDPIAKSLSPALFQRAYNGKYIYDLIQGADFDASWEVFLADYKAINVTAPFKVKAFERSDRQSPEAVKCGASNLCVKTSDGVVAYNSDYLGVKAILETLTLCSSAAVVGFGGAGKAALAVAQDCGFECKLYRHNEISEGLEADIVIFTLPSAAPGTDKIRCKYLLEANYKNPALSQRQGYIENYIPGTTWLHYQALLGYSIMTGEKPQL